MKIIKASILVVDDSLFVCAALKELLKSNEIQVDSVHSATEAFAYLAENQPDLILLDVVLRDQSGYDTCRQIKRTPKIASIPIIFLTSNNDEESILKGFGAGAVDFITKPFRAAELRVRINTHLQNKKTLDKLHTAYAGMEKNAKDNRIKAIKDPVTNLFNRRYFVENLEEWRSRANSESDICLLLIDIDNFKIINDTYGHCAGDYILFCVAGIMMQHSGYNAIVGRWGGEEFLIVLFDTQLEEATEIAENVRLQTLEYDFSYEDQPISCSITIGATQINPLLDTEKNIAIADEALYEGKNRGKNCVVVKSSLD